MSGGGKLFLGGLAGQTTKETLQYYFGQFGNVVDAVVMPGRGFGFVTFDSPDIAQHVLSLEHVLDERTIDCKAADNKGGQKGGGKGDYAAGPPQPSYGGAYSHSPDPGYSGGGGSKGRSGGGGGNGTTDKIFVGGLPVDTTDDALRSHFEVYGTLVDVVVMKDRMTQKPRGFGFVQYDNFDSAEKVMADYATHQIGGKWVECKRATPQDKTGGGKGCNGGKSGGGYPPANPYGGYQPSGGGPAYGDPYGTSPTAPAYGGPAYGGAYGAPPAYGGAYGAPPPDYGAYGGYGGGGYAPAPAYGKGKGKYSPY